MTTNKNITIEVAAKKWFNALSWKEFTQFFTESVNNGSLVNFNEPQACTATENDIIIMQYKNHLVKEKLKLV